MHASLPCFDRRGIRLSSLVLAGAALLGACDNDRPVGPNPAAIPEAANPALVAKGGRLAIKIVDQKNQVVTTLGAQFTVGSSGGGPAYFLVDNGPGDADPAIGVLEMKGLIGNFNVCQTVAPTDYVLPNQPCQSVTIPAGILVKKTVVNLTVARLAWEVVLKNGLQPAGYLGGASFWGFDNLPQLDTIVDNSPMDLDPALGKFEIKVPSGSYNLCPLATPKTFMWPGPLGPNNGCIGLPVPHGQTTFLATYSAIPEYSAFWAAQDLVNFQYAGPSTYEVKGGASGTFFATVEDNGKYDLEPGLGEVWIQLPEDGEYEVCQTVAPPKLQIAVDPCRKITVILGQPAYAFSFQSWPL